MKKGIVHISHPAGHRKAYQDLLVALTNFDPVLAPVSRQNLKTLLKPESVLFATVGGDFRRYFWVGVLRALLGKTSCTLFLGAMALRKNNNPAPSYFDRLLSKVWKALPKQQTLAILPYKVEPSLSEVTNDYIYDPQMWDMWLGDQPEECPSTSLSEAVLEESKGRKIIIFIGKGAKRKSFPELVQFAKANQERLFVVAAGKIMEECTTDAEELCSFGMRVENRYITDEELLSLYGIADYAWCFYSPEYDQASGIYGRAAQLGVIPVMRRGAIIERLSQELNIPYLSFSIENFKHNDKSKLLDTCFTESPLTIEERQKLFTKLRVESLKKLSEVLNLDISLHSNQ